MAICTTVVALSREFPDSFSLCLHLGYTVLLIPVSLLYRYRVSNLLFNLRLFLENSISRLNDYRQHLIHSENSGKYINTTTYTLHICSVYM